MIPGKDAHVTALRKYVVLEAIVYGLLRRDRILIQEFCLDKRKKESGCMNESESVV